MRLLLVEDDPVSASALTRVLEDAGHRVDVIHDRSGGLILPANDLYDAVVADRMLLRLGRLSACTGMMAADRIPPLLLFGRETDMLDGFDGGGDCGEIVSQDLSNLLTCLSLFSARRIRAVR